MGTHLLKPPCWRTDPLLSPRRYLSIPSPVSAGATLRPPRLRFRARPSSEENPGERGPHAMQPRRGGGIRSSIRTGILSTLALAALLGCGPVKISTPYAEVPQLTPPKLPLLLLKSLDAHGPEREGSLQTTQIYLPGTTHVNQIGHTAWVSTTPGQTASLPTSYVFGQSGIDALDRVVRAYLDAVPSVGKQVLDGHEQVLLDLDEQQLARACQRAGVQRAVVMQIHRLEFTSDAGIDQFSWALLGALTLGLAMPFVALERWHGALSLTARLYLFEVGKGLTRQRRYQREHRAQGCCLPGWASVVHGVLPWALSHLASDLTQTILQLAS